jgi:hypothetical protein
MQPEIAVATPISPPAAVATSPSQDTVTAGTFSAVFVDCIPLGRDFKTLSGYVDALNTELARRYCVGQDGKPSVQDIRCAPKHVEVLAFGAWKGALAEVVKAQPPEPGCYYLDTRGNELAEVVADAMRTVCSRSGALYVRGVR